MHNKIQQVLEEKGFGDYEFIKVSGGDINETYRIQKNHECFFVKLNLVDSYPDMFQKEANALQFLEKNTTFIIPKVIDCFSTKTHQLLILQWVDRGKPNNNFWTLAGEKLAFMHQYSHPFFGWKEDNFIGYLKQTNACHSKWTPFYENNRLIPLSKELQKRGLFVNADMEKMEQLCERLINLIPEEKPSLLHGDLWSGNIMPTVSSEPCLYDPAVYFGHREMDIAMTLLFGGFPDEFYDAYESVYPLSPNWKERTELMQLYSLLAHAVHFEGSYLSSVKIIIKRYL